MSRAIFFAARRLLVVVLVLELTLGIEWMLCASAACSGA